MQLPGPSVWRPPRDHDEAILVLRRAVELGVDFIDTADCYGPYVAEQLIHEALHPYPEQVVIATKAGLTRTGPIHGRQASDWPPLGRPEYLRQEAVMSPQRLGVETLDLFQLHRIDPKVPLEDQVGTLKELQEEGKVRHVGLSGVSLEQLRAAQRIVAVASVQNQFNLVSRTAEDVLEACTRESIAFIPFVPLAVGQLAGRGGDLDAVAARHDASAAQVALAWLLRRSPVMVPIPGTSSVGHLEDNLAARSITLSAEEFEELSRMTT